MAVRTCDQEYDLTVPVNWRDLVHAIAVVTAKADVRLTASIFRNRPEADVRFNESINHVYHFLIYDELKEVGEALNISSRTVQRRVKEYGLPDCKRTNNKRIINPQNTICLFEELSWLY